MKRPLDTEVRPVGVNALCGADYLLCPVLHADTPAQCTICGVFHDKEDCHRCNCTACHIERERWRQQSREGLAKWRRDTGRLFA